MSSTLPLRRRPSYGTGAGLSLVLLATAFLPRTGAQTTIPDPTQALSPSASAVLYVDAQALAQSAVAKSLGSLLEDLPSQLSNLPGGSNLPVDSQLAQSALQALEQLQIAQLILVAEGQPGETKDTDSLLVVAKLAQTIPDQEALIGQLLDLAEKQQAGVKDQLLSSRSRQGAADFFDLPSGALGTGTMPFPLGLAIGPGTGGSVLALGRTDTLKSFLAGQTQGQLPQRVDQILLSRGQLWVYATLPPDVANAMGAGVPSGGPGAPPMLAGLSQSLKEVRDFGASISMGGSSMDISLALGCASANAAGELAQGIQALQGMASMMTAQDPAGTPSALRNLKAAASGDVFRLNTSVTLADIQKAVKAARTELGGMSSGPAPVVDYDIPEVQPLEDATPQVAIELLALLPDTGGHVRRGKLRVVNSESKAIETLRVTYVYLDEKGVQLGQWTRLQQDTTPVLVPASSTRELQVSLFNLPPRTTRATATLKGVAFTDGSQWP